MANKMQKQKGVLVGVSIAAIIIGIAAIIVGIILCVKHIGNLAINENDLTLNIIGIIGGVILVIGSAILTIWGGYTLWIGLALKATKGSIAETNLAKGTVNGKVCPKCGCTNTPDSVKCTSCGTDL